MRSVSIIIILLIVTCLASYQWNEYCPLDLPIYNANFEFENIEILCTDGLLIRTESEWDFYDSNGLSALNAIRLDDENLLILFGLYSNSDGVYKFNMNTYEFELIDWFFAPQFLYYNSTNYLYYLGSYDGLFRSYNGLKWVKDNSFDTGSVNSMNNQDENFVLSQDQNIYNWEYTETPNFSPQQDLGLLELDEIDEASGIVASRLNANVFWAINDSGGDPAVYAFNSAGEHLGIYTIDGAFNRDWEDIAIGGGPEYGQYIYVADIGDNNNQYDTKYIYRFEEPFVSNSQAPVTETIYDAETISVQYPTANYDAETLLHDPLTNDLYIVTKRLQGSPVGHDEVYRAEFPQSTTQTIVMEDVGDLSYPPSLDPYGGAYHGATAGEISPLGDEILIKTYTHVYYWKRHQNQTLVGAFQNDYNSVTYMLEPQGEAICWEPHCNGYFTTSEEPASYFPAHLYFYDLNSWQLVNDYTSVRGFQFASDGTLYAYMPGESYSSGLHSSADLGENWDVCFWDTNLSALALDREDNIFTGWEEEGVGFWEYPMVDPLMMNTGLENQNIFNIVDFPIIDTPSVLACTQSGAYFLTDYTDTENYEFPIMNYDLQNHPNPFNPITTIWFNLSTESSQSIEVIIYNLKGQNIKNIPTILSGNEGSAIWNGTNQNNDPVSSGVYFYQLRVGEEVKQTKKMLLLK
ncbi:MAG: T9SS type A sorting domain-containing protein [Candidatus Cloacimonetes bacterium]|nr:T9SS type A sorting domain-containing protein [Candidatus Cloacimonadota bacterium]